MKRKSYFTGKRPEGRYPRCLVCELEASWHCDNLECWWYRCVACEKLYDPNTMRTVPLVLGP